MRLDNVGYESYKEERLSDVHSVVQNDVQYRLQKYIEDNGLHSLPESLFDITLRKFEEGYEILDFFPEKNFENKGFYRFLMLKVKDLKNGSIYNYPMQINDNSKERFGILYIPKIGDKFIFINEFRLGAGDFILNFPRGFPEKIDNVLREFLEEVSDDFDWSKMKINKIGKIFEAPSVSFNKPEFYELEYLGDVSSIKFGGTEQNRIVLLTEEEVDEKILNGEICDNYTLAAWGCYKARKTQRETKGLSLLEKIKDFFSTYFLSDD
ncbi:MAG: NUDIX hydrolase [Bdellovibrionota bacterium]